MHQDVESILFTESEIQTRVKELGEQISKDYKGKLPLVLGVLKGSFIFMSDLIRNMNIDLQLDFMVVSSYGRGVVTGGVVKIIKDVYIPLEGRDIIIVEDILDSGLTLDYISHILKDRNPSSIKIVTLLDKPSRRQADIQADYFGFEVPDEFVVGYGLDFDEKYRNLPYVGVLKPSLYE